MPKTMCDICRQEGEIAEDILHLRLYTRGSEGTRACLACRMVLTEVARGMMRVYAEGRMQAEKDKREDKADA